MTTQIGYPDDDPTEQIKGTRAQLLTQLGDAINAIQRAAGTLGRLRSDTAVMRAIHRHADPR